MKFIAAAATAAASWFECCVAAGTAVGTRLLMTKGSTAGTSAATALEWLEFLWTGSLALFLSSERSKESDRFLRAARLAASSGVAPAAARASACAACFWSSTAGSRPLCCNAEGVLGADALPPPPSLSAAAGGAVEGDPPLLPGLSWSSIWEKSAWRACVAVLGAATSPTPPCRVWFSGVVCVLLVERR